MIAHPRPTPPRPAARRSLIAFFSFLGIAFVRLSLFNNRTDPTSLFDVILWLLLFIASILMLNSSSSVVGGLVSFAIACFLYSASKRILVAM